MNCNGVKEGAIIGNLSHISSSYLGEKRNRPKTKLSNQKHLRLCHCIEKKVAAV